MTPQIKRQTAPEGSSPVRVPEVLDSGWVSVDPWWGKIQPLEQHPGLRTFGELEVIEHMKSGGALVDTRRPEYTEASGTLPGAKLIHWEEVENRQDEIDPERLTVLFCNGPQCTATPRAIKILLELGRDPAGLAYYRGGIRDWITLGLATVAPPGSGKQAD